MSIDHSILVWINVGWSSSWGDMFFAWLSNKRTFSLPLLLGLLGFFIWKYSANGAKLWLVFLLSILCGDFIGNTIKHATKQQRPCAVVYQDIKQPQGQVGIPCTARATAFPSNHTLNYFLAASFLFFVLAKRRIGVMFFIIATMVGVSRIYLAKHFPSQVLGGVFIGSSLGFLFSYLALKLTFIKSIRSQN